MQAAHAGRLWDGSGTTGATAQLELSVCMLNISHTAGPRLTPQRAPVGPSSPPPSLHWVCCGQCLCTPPGGHTLRPGLRQMLPNLAPGGLGHVVLTPTPGAHAAAA